MSDKKSDDQKSGRPSTLVKPKTISFKVSGADYDSFKDLAAACEQDISEILRVYVESLVKDKANSSTIEEYRARKKPKINQLFFPSEPETPPPKAKKSVRTSKKKKTAAQITDEQGDLKGGVDDAEN